MSIMFLEEVREVRKAIIPISEIIEDEELDIDFGRDIRLIDLYRYNPDDFKVFRHKLPSHPNSFSIIPWNKENIKVL